MVGCHSLKVVILVRIQVRQLMKFLYKISADVIFLVHFVLVFIVLFGWSTPAISNIYVGILIITLLSDLIFGYCILSRWEFYLRKKLNPELNYSYSWTTYYTHQFTQKHISENFFKWAAIIFLAGSLAIHFYFQYFFK